MEIPPDKVVFLLKQVYNKSWHIICMYSFSRYTASIMPIAEIAMSYPMIP